MSGGSGNDVAGEMSSAELKRAKKAVRREVLAARDALSEDERATRSIAIAERVLALPEVRAAGTVMAFWSFGSETDTAPLIEHLDEAGIRVALPRIEGQGLGPTANIVPVAYRPGDAVAEVGFGAFEPTAEGSIPPGEIDVVIVPAVAFDPGGRRVGYGGGFYDRFLPRTRPDTVRAGIGFDLQLVPGPLPAGHFDLLVDLIVTDLRTVTTGGGDTAPTGGP